MRKTLLITILGLLAMYGPHYISQAIQATPELKPSEVIWNHYCQDRGIDPENPTPEQEDEYLDVYMETDEYLDLYDSLTK